ncbi:MAG TPA: hypothetical protein V6D50_26205 [Chroococcales cyanobacterium]
MSNVAALAFKFHRYQLAFDRQSVVRDNKQRILRITDKGRKIQV